MFSQKCQISQWRRNFLFSLKAIIPRFAEKQYFLFREWPTIVVRWVSGAPGLTVQCPVDVAGAPGSATSSPSHKMAAASAPRSWASARNAAKPSVRRSRPAGTRETGRCSRKTTTFSVFMFVKFVKKKFSILYFFLYIFWTRLGNDLSELKDNIYWFQICI